MNNKPKGFAAWSPEKRREAARKGGRAAHAAGKAHVFTPEEAREAGRRGGLAVHGKPLPPKAKRTDETDSST
jgi:general stress protein YciG